MSAPLMSALLRGGRMRKAIARIATVASMPTSPKVQPGSAACGTRPFPQPPLGAGNEVVDDLDRQDGARGEERDEPVAPAEGPPAGPQPGDGEQQHQADQE